MELLTEIRKEYSIRLSKHNLKFCKIFPLTEVDEVFLELLNLHNGYIRFKELGELLGFAVIDLPSKKIFYDKAEVSILENLLKTLQRYHLITMNREANDNRGIICTPWGYRALNKKEKRLFFEGTVSLPEHFLIKITEEDNALFPFKKFSVYTDIENSKECNPFDLKDLASKDNPLMLLAANNIDDSSIEQQKIELSEINPHVIRYNQKVLNLTISLYNTNDSHELSSAINDLPSPELDKLINPSNNTDIYNNWLIEARYQYYLESSNQLSAEGLEAFKAIVDWAKVLYDSRIEWNNKLLKLLSDEKDSFCQIWTIISENAPIELITSNIAQHHNLWDWFKLTERLPFAYVLDHINDFDWDFDALFSKVESDDIQQLLEVLSEKSRISDWSFMTEMVTFEFLKENIRKYPWDFNLLTKLIKSHAAKLILENLDLDWDWSYIAGNWPIAIIIDNYEKVWNRLNSRSFLTRLLRNVNDLETLIGLNPQSTLLNKTASESGITFSTIDDIILNETTLAFLDNNNLLFWGESNISGIEANPNLLWNEPIFQKYQHKVKSKKGFTNVSASIPNFEIIDSYPDFPWDFEVISKRKNLNWNIKYIETYKKSLPPKNLLTHISISMVSNNIQFFINWLSPLEELDELGRFISLYFDFSQIQILAEILIIHEVSVDWSSVLSSYSEEMLADLAIKIYESAAALPFPDDLNSIFDRNCSLDFILENPNFPWNWNYLTEHRLDKSLLSNEDFRFEYAEQLHWPFILENIISLKELSDIGTMANLAEAISKVPNEILKKSWQIITLKIPRHLLWDTIQITENFELFHWDWDLISSMDNLPITHQFLNSYKDKINWNLLSINPYLNEFFRYDKTAYTHTGEWIKRCRKYLYEFQEQWDFSALSTIENLTWNVSIVSEFEERWDWKLLSANGNLLTYRDHRTGNLNLHQARIRKFSKYLDWKILSRRHEVTLTTDLMSKFSEKDWDWSALSIHPKFEITHNFLREQAEKAWDYRALTDHPKLELNKDLLLALPNKDWDFNKLSKKLWIDNDLIHQFDKKEWDWSLLSINIALIPDLPLLKFFDEKEGINWACVVQNQKLNINLATLKVLSKQATFDTTCWSKLSAHKELDFVQNPKLLDNYKSKWDWRTLVECHKFDFNNLEFLRKYENYLDWTHLCSQRKFQPTMDVLDQFKNKLDWRTITEKVDLESQFLHQFKDYLDWSIVSKSDSINFITPDLIERFKVYWDYYALKKNIAISHESRSKVNEIIENMPELNFYFKIKGQKSEWSGYIYHFSHIDNAVKIIKEGSIKSRKRARQLSDSAGSVAFSRTDPHKYARFYFRPHTQTQFYNEFLGIDSDLGYNKNGQWHSWYDCEYRKLAYPKCPKPVYFEFDLQEIILKLSQYCQISTGNMQRNSTKHGTILNFSQKFNFQDLFLNPGPDADEWRRYRAFAQQELLILDELSFENLKYMKIICSSSEDKNLLLTLMGGGCDKIVDRVSVDPSFYRWENPTVECIQMGSKTRISSRKKADGHFVLSGENFDSIAILDGDFMNHTSDKIYFKSFIEFEDNGQYYACFYIDEIKREWLVYSNKALDLDDFELLRNRTRRSQLFIRSKSLLFS